ncbi:hypothetical protein [Stutzerimonas stutzeri]|uniref:hypothetical protein n=1 Tax=Stutzerimonas stutzeri TaxID=316 RepID=UPI00210BF1AD|nr:hypothetical protein [Stutzerimonas stutzeri]MCQ4260411.1 hypothetical protein [Stutzerimonas stutzeri]
MGSSCPISHGRESIRMVKMRRLQLYAGILPYLGRVFREGSKELEEFKKTGEPAKQFTDIGTGPEGMTVKSADESTMKDYLQAIKK